MPEKSGREVYSSSFPPISVDFSLFSCSECSFFTTFLLEMDSDSEEATVSLEMLTQDELLDILIASAPTSIPTDLSDDEYEVDFAGYAETIRRMNEKIREKLEYSLK